MIVDDNEFGGGGVWNEVALPRFTPVTCLDGLKKITEPRAEIIFEPGPSRLLNRIYIHPVCDVGAVYWVAA
jgi:hypothetical protein